MQLIVNVSDAKISRDPDAVITTYSLGSCIGIALYDPIARVGGLAHSMLPDSSLDPIKAAATPAMFVDTALPALVRAACELKAEVRRMKIYLAGGAQIMDSTGFFNIGKRNYRAIIELLARHEAVDAHAHEDRSLQRWAGHLGGHALPCNSAGSDFGSSG